MRVTIKKIKLPKKIAAVEGVKRNYYEIRRNGRMVAWTKTRKAALKKVSWVKGTKKYRK